MMEHAEHEVNGGWVDEDYNSVAKFLQTVWKLRAATTMSNLRTPRSCETEVYVLTGI
jgi:hypothetical protein